MIPPSFVHKHAIFDDRSHTVFTSGGAPFDIMTFGPKGTLRAHNSPHSLTLPTTSMSTNRSLAIIFSQFSSFGENATISNLLSLSLPYSTSFQTHRERRLISQHNLYSHTTHFWFTYTAPDPSEFLITTSW